MSETLHWYAQTTGGKQQGSVTVSGRDGALHLAADLPAGTLKSVRAELPWKMDAADRLFMNGYQTWTYSPELDRKGKLRGVDHIPGFLLKKYFFDRYGDYHFVPYGQHNGQSHGFSYCYFRSGNRFRLAASLDERPGYTIFRYDSAKSLLTLERDCAGVEHPGGAFPLFDLFFTEGSEDEVFDGWFRTMDIRPRTREKLMGYSSWYNRYEDITEASIREDLAGCETLLAPGDLFQVDDGWEPKVGDWLEADPAKFPQGMKQMAEAIHASGFCAGLWLAPFVCEKDSAVYRQHPDWLLQVKGKPWCCGGNWSSFYALDIDNPDVLDYLHRVFDRVLSEWGFDLVKLDFLYGAAPFGNARESRAARMHRAMELLRGWCGEKQILGCGVPVMPAFGLADYCRVGCDVSLDWDDVWYMRLFHRERVSTKQALNNTVFRRQLNGRAYGSDPDVFFLREENCRLTTEQKKILATVNALLGQVFLTSDMPVRYTEQQRAEYRRLRTLAEQAEQVQVETAENGAFCIRYRMDGKTEQLRFRL
jgi:alpha-galactosidase